MGKPRHTAEQIIGKLREAEVLTSKGMPMEEVLRQLGISDATYYKWRKEYGGLRIDQAKRLKELEQENSKLRKVIADLTIDNAILKEAARGNYWARPRNAGQQTLSRKSLGYRNDACVVCWSSHARLSAEYRSHVATKRLYGIRSFAWHATMGGMGTGVSQHS
jgi:putative transposase